MAMRRGNIRTVGGHAVLEQSSGSMDLNGVLSHAMKAVNDAKRAVAQIQNVTHLETAPPRVPPNLPVINPKTGKPKPSSDVVTVGHQPNVFQHNTATHMTSGHIVNIVNSQNVQVGNHNRMFVQRFCTRDEMDSDSESDEDLYEARRTHLADEETVEILRDSQRQVSDAELQRLSQHVGGPWRRLIRLLGIEDAEVDYVFHTHQGSGLAEVVYTLLKKWKQENSNPTVGELIRALEKANLNRLLRHLKP